MNQHHKHDTYISEEHINVFFVIVICGISYRVFQSVYDYECNNKSTTSNCMML